MGGVELVIADELGNFVARFNCGPPEASLVGNPHRFVPQRAQFVEAASQTQHPELGPHRPDRGGPIFEGERVAGEGHRLGLGTIGPGSGLGQTQAQMAGVQTFPFAEFALGDGLLHPRGQGGRIGNGRQPNRFVSGGAQMVAGLRPQPGLLAMGGNFGRRRVPVGQRLGDARMRRFARGGGLRVNDVGAQQIMLQGVARVRLDHQAAGEQLSEWHVGRRVAGGGPLVQRNFARVGRRARQRLAGGGGQGGETTGIHIGQPGQGRPVAQAGRQQSPHDQRVAAALLVDGQRFFARHPRHKRLGQLPGILFGQGAEPDSFQMAACVETLQCLPQRRIPA